MPESLETTHNTLSQPKGPEERVMTHWKTYHGSMALTHLPGDR